jgi:hypothetical protein
MPVPTPGEEALALALEVPTGFEIEFNIKGTVIDGDRHRPVNRYNYGDILGRVPGWQSGNDPGDNAEMRSEHPTPLGEQFDRLRAFCEWTDEAMSRDNVGLRMTHGKNRSCHVHINRNPAEGRAINVEHFVKAWLAMRDEAYTLCADPGRLDMYWCGRLSDDDLDGGIAYYGKCRELERSNNFQTLELRIWDSTSDADLLLRRAEFLQRLIATSIQMELDVEAAAHARAEHNAEVADQARERLRAADEQAWATLGQLALPSIPPPYTQEVHHAPYATV